MNGRRPVVPATSSVIPSNTDPKAKILVLTSSFGGGHRMVARTLAETLRTRRPYWDVQVLDFFEEFVGAGFARAVAISYVLSARRMPFLYGAFYDLAQWVGEHKTLQAWVNRLGRARLRDYLQHERPDLIVSTYPTPSAVTADLKCRGLIRAPLVTTLTDFATHSQWVHEGVDLYIVGHEGVRRELVALGVPETRVQATGVPIRPGFVPPEKRPNDGGVLITVGAQGMLRRAEALCRAVAACAPRTVVICGHDRVLQRRLKPMVQALNGALEVRGFVDDIHRYCAAASLFVGKPGGVTVAEMCAVGLPMVLYGAIPGQEHANQEFLLRAGAARVSRTTAEARGIVSELLSRPAELAQMARYTLALGKPRATEDAVSAITDLCGRG